VCLLLGSASAVDIYAYPALYINRSTSVFPDRTRSSWRRRLFTSASVPDDETAGANNVDNILTADLPSG